MYYLFLPILLIWGGAFLLCQFFLKQKFRYWEKLGVPGPKPNILSLGNVAEIFGPNLDQVEIDYLQSYGDVYGVYYGLEPILTVSNPNTIKEILVRDFHLITNRRQINGSHKVMQISQFFAPGSDWKRLRAISSPTFSSGKLRAMLPIINNCIHKLTDYMGQLVEKNGGVMLAKEVCVGFTCDVIMTIAFGTETDSNNLDNENVDPIVQHALDTLKIHPIRAMSLLTMPKWFNDLVKVEHFFNVKSIDFFTELAHEIIKKRKETKGNKPNDFIQLLMDAHVTESQLRGTSYSDLTANMDNSDDTTVTENGNLVKSKKVLNEDEVISQCLVFFIGGFETTSSAISGLLYELSRNPGIQKRLYEELSQELYELDPNSDEYLNLLMNGLPFFNAVIKEALRRYPPGTRIERAVTTDQYQLGNLTLKKGQVIHIPMYAVHHNPDYFKDPYRFDPERFMPEKRHLLVPYSYLPFSAGPRNCIGMRFAYMELKLCIAQLVEKFTFYETPKTPTKLKYTSMKFTLFAESFEVGIQKR